MNDPVKAVLKRIRLYGTNLYRPRLLDFARQAATIATQADPVVMALAPEAPGRLAGLREEFGALLTAIEGRQGPNATLASVPMALDREQAFLLYALARLRRPRAIVETGVAKGVSTFFLLNALRENQGGSLTSFDIDPGAGALLRPDERASWRFVVLDRDSARRQFSGGLASLPHLDLFVHDSDHSYGYQSFEYHAALPRMEPGSLLASDDVDGSFAFLDFCAARGYRSHYLVSPAKVFGVAEVADRPSG